MKKSLLFLIAFSLMVMGSQVQAAGQDIRLVVDISGSMKRTDPNNLRIPTANMLADLLPDGSEAGVWTFAREVNMLVKHGQVNDAWRDQVRKKADKINSVGLYTHIDHAIETVTWDADWEVDKDRHLILLSDGLVDLSQADTQEKRSRENQASRDHLLRERLPQLVDAGYTLHTLALSDEADQDLMATLAQRSGGLHAIAYEADDLMPLLLQILNRVVDSEQVPLEGNQFSIDPLINEFTALVFHQPDAEVVLQNPSGESYTRESNQSNLNWHGNARYTLVTVNEPEAGEWQIQTPAHPDNRITVVSDLKLHTSSFPATVYRGFPDKEQTLKAWFTEEGQRIDRREFLRLLDAQMQHHQDDLLLTEKSMPFQEDSLDFRASLTGFEELGEQQVTVLIDGHTFQRQVTHSFNVQDVVAANLQLPENGGTPKIVLRAQHPQLDPDQLNFKVTANDEAQPVEYRGDGEWQVDLANLEPGREYLLEVEAEGTLKGERLNLVLPSMRLEEGSVRALDRQPEPPQETEESQQTPPDFVPNIAPQLIPSPVLPTPSASPGQEVGEEREQPSQSDEQSAPSVADEPAEEKGLFEMDFSPIKSWDDPRMLWVYVALGLANILLFTLAFILYRRFIRRRKERHDAQVHDDEDTPDIDDLEFDLDDELDPGK